MRRRRYGYVEQHRSEIRTDDAGRRYHVSEAWRGSYWETLACSELPRCAVCGEYIEETSEAVELVHHHCRLVETEAQRKARLGRIENPI